MRRLALLCAFFLLFTGCAVNELRTDQDKIRLTVLELQTNQLIDNLVRAANGMPIIHLDYGTAQATVSAKNTAMASDGYALTHSNVLTSAAAATLMTTRTAVNTFMGTLTHDHSNIVAVTATPLTTSVEAYNAYLQFLALPGSLQVSDTPPPPGAAHICRRYGKEYYWIPVEFKDRFYDLALATISERGRLLIPPPEQYTVSLLEVLPETTKDGRVIVRIDQEIPNDTGGAIFSDKKIARLVEYEPPEKGLHLFETNRIAIYLNNAPLGTKTAEDLQEKLKQGPIDVNVQLDNYRPPPPTRNQLLDMIPFQSQQVPWNALPTCKP